MRKSTETIAKEIRKKVIKMHQKGPHIGSALSIVDILAVLYFDIMRIPSLNDPERDRFILSKGHAVSALYATLSQKGYFDKTLLERYICKGSVFYGHPVRGTVPGVEISSGSLGHGLCIGVGMALSAKRDRKKFRVYIVMGDGECQEGSVWEGAMHAARLKLDNIIVIIDANNLQGYDIVENIQPISTFKQKWSAFGWSVREVNGHSVTQLRNVLKRVPFVRNRPSVIIAHTVKCKGIPEMENKMGSHYCSIPEDKVDSFIDGLA